MQVSRVFAALAIVAASAFSAPVSAAPQEVTNSLAFETSIIKEQLAGREPITRAHVTCGTKRFTFVVPEGFRVDGSSPERLVMTSSNYSCFISLCPARLPSGDKPAEAQTCKEKLLGDYPDAVVREEFTLNAGNSAGPAMDFQSKMSDGTMRAGRIAFIPCLRGTLQFTLMTSPEQFSQFLSKLQTVLLTFRVSDADGKIETATLSDRI